MLPKRAACIHPSYEISPATHMLSCQPAMCVHQRLAVAGFRSLWVCKPHAACHDSDHGLSCFSSSIVLVELTEEVSKQDTIGAKGPSAGQGVLADASSILWRLTVIGALSPNMQGCCVGTGQILRKVRGYTHLSEPGCGAGLPSSGGELPAAVQCMMEGKPFQCNTCNEYSQRQL